MNKKLNACLVLSFILFLFCTLNSVVFAENEQYKLYYDYIQTKLDTIGYMKRSEIKSPLDREGIIYARLIDMNGDGTSELITFESIADRSKPYKTLVQGGPPYYNWHEATDYLKYLQVFLYTIKDNSIVKLHSNSLSYCNVGICTDKNNKSYLVYDEDNHKRHYYGVNNGNLTEEMCEWVFHSDWSASGTVGNTHVHIESDTGTATYYVNDKKVSQTEYINFEKNKRNNGFVLLTIYDSPNELGTLTGNYYTKSEPIPDNTPYEVIDYLKTIIPDYISNYYNPSNWAKEIVEEAINCGYVDKQLQKRYSEPITREQFCVLATQYYETVTGSEISEREEFHDTSNVNVQKMAGLGVVTGTGECYFEPNKYLTREQAAVIISRLAFSLKSNLKTGSPTFNDNELISSWAEGAVGQMQIENIMSGTGDNCFSPKSYYTREQSIATIMKLKNRQGTIEDFNIVQDDIELLPSWTIQLRISSSDSQDNINNLLLWKSSDESVATVIHNSGLVTGVSSGNATITATAPNGIFKTCQITVLPLTTKNYYIDIPSEIAFYDKNEKKGVITINDIDDSKPESPLLKGHVTRERTEDDLHDHHTDPAIGYYVEDSEGNIVYSEKYNSYGAWSKSFVKDKEKSKDTVEYNTEADVNFSIYLLNSYKATFPLKITIVDSKTELPPKSDKY